MRYRETEYPGLRAVAAIDADRPLVVSRVQPAQGENRPVLDYSVLVHYRLFGLPVWVHDPVGHRHAWANEAAVRFWGASSMEELLSRSYADMTPGAFARLEIAMQAHRRGETTKEHWTLYPGGKPTSTVLHGSGIALPDGTQAILFIAEAPMQHDPDMLRSTEALLHMPVLAAVHRLDDGRALMRNPAAVLALGPIDEHSDFDGQFVDPAVARAVIESVRAGRSHRCDAQLATPAGAHWHAIDAHAAWDPVTGARVLCLSARDIAELKVAQEQLEVARRRAEAANDAKTAFLAHMSHELRTPLNGVLGMLQVALHSELSAEQRRWLEVAHASGRLLLTLLNDLLDLSKIEAGRIEIERVSFDLAELMAQTLTPLVVEARAKGLQMHSRVDPALPVQVVGDPVRLRQVLFNVVGNAIKFTREGSIHVSVNAAPVSGRDVELRFDVADTGIGMAHEQLERVFEPFIQADASTSRRYGGTGLGLTIVRRLVELMDGRVGIRSQPGQGCTVQWTVRCALP